MVRFLRAIIEWSVVILIRHILNLLKEGAAKDDPGEKGGPRGVGSSDDLRSSKKKTITATRVS